MRGLSRGRLRGLARVGVALLAVSGGMAAGAAAVGPGAQGGSAAGTKAAAQASQGNPAGSAPAQPVLPLSSDQVAAHLGETVDWFHHVSGVEQLQVSGGDIATRDKLHQQMLVAVGLAFDFGKACAALLNEQARAAVAPAAPAATAGKAVAGPGQSGAASDSKGFAGRLDEAAADVGQRVAALQTQLDAVNEQLTHVKAKERETLIAQQGQLTAALRLAREIQSSVQTMEQFESSAITGDNGNLSPLEGQIADMQRSVPELSHGAGGSNAGSGAGGSGGSGKGGAAGGATGGTAGGGASGGGAASGGSGGGGGSGNSGAPGGSAASVGANFRPDSAGVIALVSEWFSLSGMRKQMDDYIKETSDLQEETTKVRAKLTDEVRNVVGNDLAIGATGDSTQLLAQRQELEADTARFKKLSTVLVPLGEQALTVDSAAGILDDWRGSIDARMSSIARYLLVRIAVLLGWVAAVLIVSEIWRRATFRYLHDVRRRRQFTALRRVVVGIALTVVVAFGLVSEIGSIATYIGFITAGVAVALQNVILAVVAYFFFIGRYGVRVGDRVTLAGVTGRVVDIGLVRIYLMELSGPDLRSTGRMVVLSNAVLFQPTAMFKQIPGADYAWHTVTLTIAASADVAEAHKRLKAAAEAVYAKYRPAIERQHAMVQRFIDFDASSPQPEVRLRLTENGLECSVRYPVELENAALIDQQMLSALREALEKDSRFQLVSSGGVALKAE